MAGAKHLTEASDQVVQSAYQPMGDSHIVPLKHIGGPFFVIEEGEDVVVKFVIGELAIVLAPVLLRVHGKAALQQRSAGEVDSGWRHITITLMYATVSGSDLEIPYDFAIVFFPPARLRCESMSMTTGALPLFGPVRTER